MATLPSCSDYTAAIQSPPSLKEISLKGGMPILMNGRPIMYTGGFCVVFPFIVGQKKWALRFWHVKVEDSKRRTKIISDKLKELLLPYFVEFVYVEDGILTTAGLQPIVKMDWVEALDLKKFLGKNINSPDRLKLLSENFLCMVRVLHQHKISHGDLQHGNILVKDDCSVILVDYDSMCIPSLEGEKEEIKGLVGYQHPSRSRNSSLTHRADYFSELVIYLSILVLIEDFSIWNRLNITDTEELVFTKNDFESPYNSAIFNELLSSNCQVIKQLTSKLVIFCTKNSIDDLEPLEEIIKPPIDINTLSQKWGTQMPVPPIVEVNIDQISKKW